MMKSFIHHLPASRANIEFGPDDRLYGPIILKGQIGRVDVDTGSIETVAEGFSGTPSGEISGAGSTSRPGSWSLRFLRGRRTRTVYSPGGAAVMEIRTFAESDRAELRHLFSRAGEGAPTASLWGHAESEAAIYLDPYMDLDPDSLFLAVVNGTLVGYLAGCRDSSKFPRESKRMEEAIRKYRLVFRPRPAAFFARSMVDMAWASVRREPTAADFDDARWPAHLHINVEPRARGTGAAEGLMKRWLDRLRATGSPGCHLQTLCENTRAVRFFERMGFVKHGPTPLVPGLRHEGKRLHQQTMVWNPSSH